MQKFKDTCDQDISLGIKNWLAQASNRIKKKENKNSPIITPPISFTSQ